MSQRNSFEFEERDFRLLSSLLKKVCELAETKTSFAKINGTSWEFLSLN